MNKIMETKKKKYVKPKLTVAEWDFNEAICRDDIMLLSICMSSEKGAAPVHHVNEDRMDDISWGTYNDPIENSNRW